MISLLSILCAIALIKLRIFLSTRQIDVVDGQNICRFNTLRFSKKYQSVIKICLYLLPIFIALIVCGITNFNGAWAGFWYVVIAWVIANHYIYVTKYYLSINETGITWRKSNKVHKIIFSEVACIHTTIVVTEENNEKFYSKLTALITNKNKFIITGSELLDYSDFSSAHLRDFGDLVALILGYCEPYQVQVINEYKYYTPA